MAKDKIKKKSAQTTFGVLAVITFIYGALTLGWADWTGWIPSILKAGLSLVLIFELGIKRWTPISNLQQLKPMQKIGLTLALFTLIVSILSIPPIGWLNFLWVNQIVGFVLILEGLWAVYEINN